MAYLYTHTRTDTHEIFYIGIGSDVEGKYIRAFSKRRRSKFWNNIISSTDYKIDIMYDNLSWKEVCIKEIELIEKYGRRDLNKGTLCNMTTGGDGVNGYKHTKDRLFIISNNTKGSNNPRAKKCIHFSTSLEFNSLKEGCEYFNLSYGYQSNAVKNKLSTALFCFKDNPFIKVTKEEIGRRLGRMRIGNNNSIHYPVIHIVSKLEFNSLTQGCKYFNLNIGTEYQRIKKNLANRSFNYKSTECGNNTKKSKCNNKENP